MVIMVARLAEAEVEAVATESECETRISRGCWDVFEVLIEVLKTLKA